MGTKKSNKLYAAAAALAVTASAVAPGLTADAASKVTVKSVTNPASISHYGGYTFAVKKLSLPKTVKVLLSNKKYENRSVKWGKVSYDKKYIGKYQTISGTVSGTAKKASIKVKLNNYPVDVVEPKLAPVAVGEKLNLPSTIDVKYKDGKVIARSAKSFNLTAEKTDKAGEMKLSYNYMGKNSSIKGSIAYEVKAAEITNVMGEVKVDDLSVSADVKFPAKDAKAQLLIFPGKDESKALPAIDGKLENGKFTATGKNIPVGTHSFAVKIGDVVSPAKDFVIESPMVKEVKAINAKQVEVSFNKAVNETAAETLNKYSIDNVNPSSVSLSEDGMTATLTFASATQVEVTNGVVVVQPIALASDADKSTAKYTKVLTFEDTVKPEISEVVAKTSGTTATELTVTASEPIVSSLAKVDGNYYTVTFSGKTGTITGLSLEANKEHTIELINLTDFGGNVTVQTSKSFNVSVDAVAPTVSLAPQGDNDIILTFSKPMNTASVEGALVASANLVKDELLGNVNYSNVTVVPGSNDTKFLLDVTASLFTNKDSRTLSVVLPGTMKDKLGNSFNAGTQAVTLVKDAAKPVATDFKIVKNSQGQVTSLEVYFNEGLRSGTPVLPTIVNENGVAVSASSFLGGLTASAVTAGDKKIVYTATTPAALSGKYAFSFGAGLVSDQAQTANTSAAFNHTFDFGTANAGTFSLLQANVTAPAKNQIRVNFVSAVKGGAVANSATDLANYTLGGKPLPAGTSITLDTDQEVATIVLPDETFNKTDSSTIITVANVEALNGAKLNAFNGTVNVTDNVKPVLSNGSLTADNKISLGFSEAFAAGTPVVIGDVIVKVNGTTVPAAALTLGAGSGSDAGKYLVSLQNIVEQGTAANNGADNLAGTPDDVAATPTYIDLDNSGTFNAGDIKIADGPVADFKFSTSGLINSVTVTTANSTVGADAAGNTLKTATTITVK
ncbi:Ig-like domain-containing protein [Exiguobacterium sp. MH3]|uniref:Ig-like domain-containing protein n=1 Tax=Exiguobacterium sp. MH3 TaxID=1399115 RepID=UPI0003C3BF0F|nr:Ig-like domain-containing protein [Exiguobacterium sp. MH3]AHA31544.1 hypothetical protein U719_14470 [Exiguobacterium sp. MH3]